MKRGVTLLELLAASALLSLVVVGALPVLVDSRRMLAAEPSISISQLGLFADLALDLDGPASEFDLTGFIATTLAWSSVSWPEDFPNLTAPSEGVTVTLFRDAESAAPGSTANGWLEFRCERARVYRLVQWSVPDDASAEETGGEP